MWALTQMGETATSALIIALKHNNEKVRQRAATALGKIGTPEAILALQKYGKKPF